MKSKFWIIAALAALFAMPALAQDAPAEAETEAEAEATAEDDDAGLDEIIVTAQHRSQDFREVPISMTVVGIEEMKDRNIGDINELGDIVPNIQVKTGATVSFIFFRGLGSGLKPRFRNFCRRISGWHVSGPSGLFLQRFC